MNNLDNLTPQAKRKLLAKLLTANHHPLSFAQERLWFLDQYEPDTAVFNMPLAYQLTGQLNPVALEASLNEIIRRHDTLRTTFQAKNGRPYQLVLPTLEISLSLIDLSGLQPTAQAARLNAEKIQNFQQPFNLQTGPLIRAALLRLTPQKHQIHITMHHIISDGWSIGIFFRELVALYQAFSNNQPSPLSPLNQQYGRFAEHQRSQEQTVIYDKQLAYWQQALDGATTVLELPTDYPRPTRQTSNGRRHTFQLPPDLTAALKQLSAQERVTPFMLLLAAYQILLSRYSAQKDFLVGTPIAGRNQDEVEDLIGFFLNTLVLRADLTGSPTFRQLLGRVRQRAIDAYDNQDIPVERLIDALNPVRDFSRTPLFQTLFALQNMPWGGFSLPDLTIEELDGYTGTAKLDLSLYISELPAGLEGLIEYNVDLFNEATIVRLADHYEQLLRAIVSNPERPIDSYTMLTTAEHRQLLTDWNRTDRPYPAHQTIPGLFEEQVAKTPEAVAFIEGDRTITYRELNRQANQIGHLLREHSIGPGHVVGISLSRSIEMVVALMGILKAGAAYLPLDPSYPAERLAYMASDAGLSILVTGETTSTETPPELDVETIHMVKDKGDIDRQPETDPALSAVSPEAVAYLIYTSGSTGQPKGLAVPHKQIINRFYWLWHEHPFSEGEVGCQRTALNFVDSIWEIFGPLLKGTPTVIIPDETVKDPAQFVAALGRHEVSRLWLVPSLLRVMLDTMPDLAERLPKLKMWVTSGETIPMELFDRFQQQVPNATIYNLYGTSEVWDVTWYPPDLAHAHLTRVPIGKPIDNMQCYVLDKAMQLVPIGVPGDLYVAGDGLAQGYLNRPSRTANTFVPHPFSQKPGERLNRSGDLARYLPDGHIEFLGRSDFQVKVRGFRIELGEVESVLMQHPAVHNTVVVTHESQPGQPRLVAYVVVQGKDKPAVNDLRDFLAQTLPEPMIPGIFVFLEALPLTPNGKVNRKALPEPESSRPELSETYTAPRTTTEKVVAEIWQEILGLSKVGVFDNFFELGGHSLLGTQVTFQIQEIFQIRLPLHEIFRKPTVAGMVENLIQLWGDQNIVEEIAKTWQTISEMSVDEAGQRLAEAESID